MLWRVSGHLRLEGLEGRGACAAPCLCLLRVAAPALTADSCCLHATCCSLSPHYNYGFLLTTPLNPISRTSPPAPTVVHTPQGLGRLVAGEVAYLQLPIMLQQYVDHGGCLFKVYVLGDTSGGR